MKSKPKPLQTLMQLKDVWIRTGVLAPLQTHQLQMWTMCVLPRTKKGEVMINQDNWTIEFHLKPEFLASFTVPKDAPMRCAYLERWVHQLLDGRVLVKVYWGKTLIFTGTRTDVPDTQEDVDFRAGTEVPEVPWKPNPKIKY